MTQKIPIGKVCYKGPHASYLGESDYGACGSHEYGTIYISVEWEYPNPRGEVFDLNNVAEMIARLFEEDEIRRWTEA